MSTVRSIATASGCTLTGFADGPGDERNVACNKHLLELDARYRKQGSP